MAMERKVPDKDTLTKWWVDEDLTRQQIADRWFAETGITVSLPAISMAVGRYGLPAKRNRWTNFKPWRIEGRHEDLNENRLLRLAARRAAGMKNSAEDETWLDNWLADLKEKGRPVVAYYPDTEEGFFYHPRVPEDGDGEWDLIRRPEVQEVLDRREHEMAG